MKTNRTSLLSVEVSLLAVGLLIGSAFASAGQTQLQSGQQPPDSVVAIVAGAQGLPFVPADQWPLFGTYWGVRSSIPCLTPPRPCPPFDPSTPVYAIGGGQFLVDETAGQLISPQAPQYGRRALNAANSASILRAQVDELQDFVAQIQASQLISQSRLNGQVSALDLDGPPAPGGGGGTNVWHGGITSNGKTYGTNDLWLEILSMSVTNSTANLVIHPSWNVTNGVYDLLYCTSLAPPISWQWVLHTDPEQTNLTVFNAADAQGFYRLGVPDSSAGTSFWVAFFSVVNNGGDLSLYISSAVGATGTVTIPGLGITNAFSVAAGAVTNIDIDQSVMMADYDVVETNGIHITASQPVSVYVVAYSEFTTSSFTGYPTTLLGTNYCVMARGSMDTSDPNPHSQFAIVATADNTTVTITPSPKADLEGHTNSYTVPTLQQGETYQINSSDNTGDVTGTWVTSDKPVAVFAGANIAFVPDTNTPYGNPLVQEQLPVDSWGRQALGLSFAGRQNGDSYRVLAATNDTEVFINSIAAGTIQAGQFLDLILDGPVEFRGSHPIQVAQFANGFWFDQQYGDPCEILLPPTGHYLETNTVITLPNDFVTGDFFENYLNIIVPQSATNNTWVDGSLVAATNYVAIGTGGYYGAQITITNSGVHTVTSSQPVGVQVYGFGYTDAYGYFGGVVK